MKLRWWLERGQGCLSSLWKAGGSFAVRSAQRCLFWNMAVLHHPASPPWSSCQKTWSPLVPLALMSQTICSRSFGQTLIFHLELFISHWELTHLSKHHSYSSTALLLSSPPLKPCCHLLWMAASVSSLHAQAPLSPQRFSSLHALLPHCLLTHLPHQCC